MTWVHAIRHGVRPDGTPLLFMPSTEFYFLSDEDLGAVIAFIKSARQRTTSCRPARSRSPGAWS